jgi:hypothetical protein
MFYWNSRNAGKEADVSGHGFDRSLRDQGERPPVQRWTCPCQEPPVLLGTYDERGRVNIKVRDRYWHVQGRVHTICPRCGREHTLDPRSN